MPVDEVKHILSKYQNEESRINELLEQNQLDSETRSNTIPKTGERKHLSLEGAIKRNKAILKDLETVKGNLRSKAIYSPSEMQWDVICSRYRATPSLPVTSWRCRLPVYV